MDITNGGEIAFVIGVMHPGLIGYLLSLYKRIIISDWNEARSEYNLNAYPKSDIKLIPFEPGKPPTVHESVDLVLCMLSQRYLGDPSQWMNDFSETLTPRGILKVVENVPRKMHADQKLADRVLTLRLKIDAAHGANLHPGCAYEQFVTHAKSCSLSQIRSPIYTDQDLLMDSDEWEYEAESLIRAATPHGEGCKSMLTKEFVNQCINIYGATPNPKPSTPPFTVVSGVKRSPRFSSGVPISTEIQKSTNVELEPKLKPADSPSGDSNLLQKLRLRGADNLSTEELLEIALKGVEPDNLDLKSISNTSNLRISNSASLLASRIISEYGSRAVASETNPSVLAETMQITLETACKIVSIFALGKRFFQEPVGRYPVIRNEDDVFRYLHDMKDLKKEHLRGLYFNVQMRLIHDEVISIGTLSRAIVHPREVFSPALEFSASSIILAHNHPSGDTSPSDKDISLTRQLAQAGRIMGIELTDHIIIGSNGYTSMKVAAII